MGSKTRIAVCDAETDPFKAGRPPRDFVWGFYDGLDYDVSWGEDGFALELFMEFLAEYPHKLLLFAHNGGKFDFFYFLKYLDKGSIKLINGRISSATLFNGKITLRDSYNIIPVPQKLFGKDEIEYWKMERQYRDKYRAEILAYLQTDCFELYKIVTAFIERFGRHLTLATVSMKLLQATVENKTRRKFERFNNQQDERFRPYYYGGRCQAFKKGELRPLKKKTFKIVDINSAYPFAMTHKHPDPTYNSFYIKTELPSHIQCYFAHIKGISNGALPWRLPEYDDLTYEDMLFCKENGVSLKRSEYTARKLFFPDDNREREYRVTGWEVQAGLDTGTLKITDIIKVRIPDKVLDFSDFVLPYYQEKKDAKAAGKKHDELFSKLIINTPYGKFALNPREFKEYCFCEYGELPPENPNDKNPYVWKPYSTYLEHDLDIYERPKHIPKKFYEDPEYNLDPDDYRPPRGFYNVAVAASVTGFTRAHLWRALCQSENPIYSDTDSIVCESFRGKIGKALGEWDSEGEADKAYIGGRKMYALRIVKGAGVRYWRDKDRASHGIDVIRSEKTDTGRRWKMATKGARLNPGELIRMVKQGQVIDWENAAPTNSLRFGQRFLTRQVKMT